MHGADGCPSEHRLLDAVVEHRLGELAEHLDACTACREVVAALAREPPAVIGRFEIERVLGSGGMGTVYLARDPELDRRVALKVLHVASPQRLVDEARAIARIAHDNLVAVYQIETLDDQLAVVMEYLPGGTLRGWLATPRGWRAIAAALAGVARGLAAIHAAGLVHRDLKPDNILFDARGRPRIVDLGLATLGGDGTAGTPLYMAPEQLAGGAADERSDQWSFFVTLQEALTGVRPGGGAVAKLPGPRALQAIVARGLDRDPARRHPSMTAVADALDRVLQRRRISLVLGGGVAIVGAVAAGFALAGDRAAPPCAYAGDGITAVWHTGAAARISAAYRAAEMPATGALVVRGLDEVAARWREASADSCRATRVRDEQSVTMLDRRTACLREQLAAVETLVARLATAADRDALSHGAQAVAELPPIADCSAARLGARPAVADPRAAAARLELARVRLLRPLGKTRELLSRVEPIIATAAALRDNALAAAARLVAADALADDLQLERAAAAFVAAELAAESAGDDDLRARTLLARATVVGALQQHPAEAAPLLERARAIIERLGERRDLEHRALVTEAALAAARGDQPAGERLLRAALATLPEHGAERALRVVAMRDLANMLFEQNRAEEAVTAARAAVAFAEATFGPDHVDVSEALSVLALTLHYAGTGADAEAMTLLERALAIKQRARGNDHVSLSSTLMVRATIERDAPTATGHAAARRTTDRAIALRRGAYAADNPLLLALIGERGSLAVDAGEYTLARASFAEAVPGLERAWGPTSPAVVQAQRSLATLAEYSGDPRTCADQLARIAAATTSIDIQRAHCLILAGDLATASKLVAAIAARDLAAAERGTIDVLAARIARGSGDVARARQIAAAVDRANPSPEPDLALDLALVLAELGQPARALELADAAIAGAGVDLAASELYARAAEVALAARQRATAARHADSAMAIATAAQAGADLLARYRRLVERSR